MGELSRQPGTGETAIHKAKAKAKENQRHFKTPQTSPIQVET